MILVEIIELIVYIDWALHVFFDYELLSANLSKHFAFLLIVIICHWIFLDLIAHDVQKDAETKENDTENCEGYHS